MCALFYYLFSVCALWQRIIYAPIDGLNHKFDLIETKRMVAQEILRAIGYIVVVSSSWSYDYSGALISVSHSFKNHQNSLVLAFRVQLAMSCNNRLIEVPPSSKWKEILPIPSDTNYVKLEHNQCLSFTSQFINCLCLWQLKQCDANNMKFEQEKRIGKTYDMSKIKPLNRRKKEHTINIINIIKE